MRMIIVLLIVMTILVLVLISAKKHYENLIDIQDEVCYELLNDARERLQIMNAMQLLSPEDYQKQTDKLIEYTDKLIRGGRWETYLHQRKNEEEGKK